MHKKADRVLEREREGAGASFRSRAGGAVRAAGAAVWVAWCGVVWCVLFAAAHLFWALGGRRHPTLGRVAGEGVT